MPENDFEKQVQQKMDELRFVPSETVWPKVEEEIREKKKRRVIFWIPLFALLLGGAAWLYYGNVGHSVNEKNSPAQTTAPALVQADKKDPENNNGNAQSVDAIAEKKNEGAVQKEAIDSKLKSANENNKPVALTNAGKNTKAITNTADKNKITATPGEDLIAKNAVAANDKPGSRLKSVSLPVSAKKMLDKQNNSHKHLLRDKDEMAFKKKQAPSNKQNKKEALVNDDKQAEQSITEKEIAQAAVTGDDKQNETAATSIKPVTDLNNDSSKSASGKTQKILKADSVATITKSKPAEQSKKKMNWGIHVQSGVSAVSSGFSGLFSGSPSYDINAFSNLNSAPSGNNAGSTGSGVVSSAPSEIKPGFSFGAGGFISKPLEKNWSVLLGLNYNYVSTHVMTGDKSTASATQTRYNTGHTQNYTNSFHFIELPVSLQKQFSQKSRWSAEGGLVFSWLAATNTVLYSSQTGTYIKDNSLVNKFQVGMRVGINYTLFPKSLPIQVGPGFYYDASNIFNKQAYGSKHLLFAGVQANIFLHKKKH